MHSPGRPSEVSYRGEIRKPTVNFKNCSCVCARTPISVHKCRIYSTAQNSSDSLPSYPSDNHHCSDVVWWRGGDPTLDTLHEPHYYWWFGSLVAKALDLQLEGCEFNSRPRRCRVTTAGKMFTPTCLSRSQWFSDGVIDCGVRGRGQLCLS